MTIAAAELRSLARLPWVWLIGAAPGCVGLGLHVLHAKRYAASHSWMAADPSFVVHGVGAFVLWTAMLGVALLAVDAVARDRRDGIAEPLAAKPLGNVAMLLGKALAIAAFGWLSTLAFGAAAQTLGALRGARGSWPALGFEASSMTTFLFVDALAMLVAWSLAAVAVAAKSTALAAAIMLAGIGAHALVLLHAPHHLLPAFAGVAGFARLASDILPSHPDAQELAQRSALPLAAGGLLLMAAAFGPRPDDLPRGKAVALAMVLIAGGALAVAVLARQAEREADERTRWALVHGAPLEGRPVDVRRVAGTIDIVPGGTLTLRLQLALLLGEPAGERGLAFVFNPGMTVRDVRVLRRDGAEFAVRHEHELGVLRVWLPPELDAAANESVRLWLHASGVPNAGFAYLDGSVDPHRASFAESGLHLLGTEASIFNDDFVALMPGTHWLPTSGARGQDGTERIRDFFEIDLTVRAPSGWAVAAPGYRGQAEDGAKFKTQAPLADLAVLAAPFAERELALSALDVRVLTHSGHGDDLAALSGPMGIGTVLEPWFDEANRHGLRYPYGVLHVVEVPLALRTFGGGWAMDSVQALPGIMMIRERTFPTHPTRHLRERNEEVSAWMEYSNRFAANVGGGDLALALRNVLGFQTSASGAEAAAVNYLIDHLLRALATPGRANAGGFSAARLLLHGKGADVLPNRFPRALGDARWIDRLPRQRANAASTWRLAERIPLSQLETASCPRRNLEPLEIARGQVR